MIAVLFISFSAIYRCFDYRAAPLLHKTVIWQTIWYFR